MGVQFWPYGGPYDGGGGGVWHKIGVP